MANIGPINGTQNEKTGKDFVNELFETDDEEEEEEMLTNREIEKNIETSISFKDDATEQTLTFINEETTQRTDEHNDDLKYPEETSKFRIDNHDIILNLSKYTLRKIVMLICDEAVCI